MGGQGSSRWGKHRAKPSADGRKSLNIHRWDELALLSPGGEFVWKFNAREPFKAAIAVTVADDRRSLTLAYKPEWTRQHRGSTPATSGDQSQPQAQSGYGPSSAANGDHGSRVIADQSQPQTGCGDAAFSTLNADQSHMATSEPHAFPRGGVDTFDTLPEDQHGVSYTVGLDWDACHLGGERPFFVCPGEGCGLRVVRLYARGALFYCRGCAGLAYRTQRMNAAQRALVKASRIKKKMGLPHRDQRGLSVPLRPKGMHRATYDELRLTIEELVRLALGDDGAA